MNWKLPSPSKLRAMLAAVTRTIARVSRLDKASRKTKNWQELAAVENYKAKIADNKALPVYNKYYKRYAARVKVNQIKEADFKKWKYQALTMRDECTGGKISVEEYTQWMEDYFPNRKPKQDKPIFAHFNG